MTVLTEGRHAAEFVISEANHMRSRGTVTIAASQTLLAGAVLGKVTANGEHKVLAPGGADGTENAAAILLYPVTTGVGVTAKAAAIVRDAEVNGKLLGLPGGITGPQTTEAYNDLAVSGIIVR